CRRAVDAARAATRAAPALLRRWDRGHPASFPTGRRDRAAVAAGCGTRSPRVRGASVPSSVSLPKRWRRVHAVVIDVAADYPVARVDSAPLARGRPDGPPRRTSEPLPGGLQAGAADG